MADVNLYVPLGSLISQELWPSDVFGAANFDFLNGIAYVRGDVFDEDDLTIAQVKLEVVAGAEFELPMGLGFVIGEGPIDASLFGNDEGYQVVVDTQVARIRLPRELFVPVIDGADGPGADPDPEHFVDIQLPVGFSYDSITNDVALGWPAEGDRTAISLPPCMLGDTGIIISAEDIIIRLAQEQELPDAAYAVELDPSWRGLYIGQASVKLPDGLASAIPEGTALTFQNCFIGTGGFSGKLSVSVDPGGAPHVELFGATFAFESLSVEIEQNSLSKFELRGALQTDFFSNPLEVVVSVDLDGSVLIRLAQEGGLVNLGVSGIFDLTLDKVEFGVDNRKLLIRTSGTLKPTFKGDEIPWPGIRLENLEIDSDGRVRVAGGWIDLPSQCSINLFGFIVEVTKLGFGREGERNWIGFSGGVRIMEGVPAGASVDGLRILWGGDQDPALRLEGIAVSLEVPGAFKMAGSVSLRDREFGGAVRVELPSVSFVVEGQFVTGSFPHPTIPNKRVKTFAVYLETQLPVGIPLGPTGLAFYGFAGLYAQNRKPDKGENEGWYRSLDLKSDGWFTRPTPGVLDLPNKWKGAPDTMALGAGVILGTFADNGFTFNGRLLLVLVFPGPVVLIDGMANLLKKRSELGGGEPNFHSLVVIDPGKSFLAALDAHYGYGDLIDIRGSAEAYFNFQDPGAWHVYLGIDSPWEKRIAARLFQLFDVSGFFMLDARQLHVGAGARIHKRWGFKHLNVTLSASIDTEAIVSWNPAHFTGSLGVQGSAELNAFGIKAGVSVGATVRGDVFDPFALSGEFRASINLPWPLPDIRATIHMEWSHDFSTPGQPPALPVPVREASIEHLKSNNTWSLERGKSLIADDGPNGEFIVERPGNQPPGPFAEVFPPFPADIPRVPSDSKLAVTFTRPASDDSLIAINPTEVQPEIIGDPHAQLAAYRADYALTGIELQKWMPGPEASDGAFVWATILTGGDSAPEGQSLSAAWQPGNEDPAIGHSEQHKLLINAVTPFDYTSGRSQSWQDRFVATHGQYPCPLIQPELSARFTDTIGTSYDDEAFSFEDPPFALDWVYGGDIAENEALISSVLGPIDRGLRVQIVLQVDAPPEVTDMMIRIGDPKPARLGSSFSGNVDYSANPLTLFDGLVLRSLTARQADAALAPSNSSLLLGQGDHGLAIGERLELLLALDPLVYVDLEFDCASATRNDLEIFAITADGSETPHQTPTAGRSVLRIALAQKPLTKIVIRRTTEALPFIRRSTAALVGVAYRRPTRAEVSVSAGPPRSFYEEPDGFVRIHAPDRVGKVRFPDSTTSHGYLVLELAIPGKNEQLVRHTQQSLSRLATEDPLFEPEADYRMVLRTSRNDRAPDGSKIKNIIDHDSPFVHHAYFHVVGPPGIGVPDQPPATQAGGTSLADLRPYVAQTLPPAIPVEGVKLLLPRAFYRGFDVAVSFNESYAELMYLRAKRDLSVRVYDVDNQPVRDTSGRISIPVPSWERSRSQSEKESVVLWVGMVNDSACRPDDLPPFDQSSVVRNQTLSAPGADVVMRAQTLHSARLVPVLLHESFVHSVNGLIADGGAHRLERWQASGSAHWRVDSELIDVPGQDPATIYFVSENTGANSSLIYVGAAGASPSDDSASEWTNFRASVVVRFSQGSVGLEFRRSSDADMLRLVLDRSASKVRLLGLASGNATTLDEADLSYPGSNTDIAISVECIGASVTVFLDDASTPLIDNQSAPQLKGGVGLRVDAAGACRFTEIRVDDLRELPSTAFTFDFVTSQFVNFYHHLHSYNDRVNSAVPGTPLSSADLSQQSGVSIAVDGAASEGLGDVSDLERRGFETLEAKALADSALTPPERLEVLRVSAPGAPLALLVRSPEPLLWSRTALSVSRASSAISSELPGALKISDLKFGSTPATESVTVLVRESSSLARHTLEWRPLATAADPDPAWTFHYEFSAEESDLPDGTQAQIFSGVATDAPTREPGTAHYFVAASASEASTHFAAPGVEFRLLAPDATTVVHQRSFFTADAFTPLTMRAVRKLDGTALLLFSTSGSAPPALRLHLTFNRALGSEDLRFRQGGSETAEQVDLEVVL